MDFLTSSKYCIFYHSAVILPNSSRKPLQDEQNFNVEGFVLLLNLHQD